jgi:hypothetical protein
MEFKEIQQQELPSGSKLHCWLNDSEPKQESKENLTYSNQQKIEPQKYTHPTDFSHTLDYHSPIIIPPFMYTIMVSLIWDCKTNNEKINHLNKVIARFTRLFHQNKSGLIKKEINNQIITYNNQLKALYKKTIASKIQLLAAQTVIKQISIADHKDLLVKSAKHYAVLAKQNSWDVKLKHIHASITLEIKYVNHYEFNEMETFPL